MFAKNLQYVEAIVHLAALIIIHDPQHSSPLPSSSSVTVFKRTVSYASLVRVNNMDYCVSTDRRQQKVK
jgi:hypothetical protein